MFYCDDCARKAEWPYSIVKSKGPCEICEENVLCNDYPSKYIPKAKIKMTKENVKALK